MSTRKGRTKIRCKVAEGTDCPATASASNGQTKVIEYFRIVHRDPSKKFKRVKIFAENDEAKATKHALELPNKMARLKSPQSSDKETESSQEWVLPVTCEAEFVSINDKIKESNNDDGKSSLEVAKNSKSSTYPTKKKTQIESEEERKKACDKMKHDLVKVASGMPPETQTSKADNVDLSFSPSALKLVESIKSSAESTLSDTLPLPTKYERLLRLFDYTEVASYFLKKYCGKINKTQGKRITLNEVMTNVQRKLKSNYDEQQFAMILSIYPESYNIRCERRWMPIGGRHCNPKEYEYVIEPNLINDLVFPRKENAEGAASSRSSPVKPMVGSPCKVTASSRSSPVKPLVGSPCKVTASLRSSPVKPMVGSPYKTTASLKSSPVKQTIGSTSKVPLISLVRNPMTSPVKATMISPTKSSCAPNAVTKCPPKLESRRLHRKLEFKNRLRKLVNIQHSAFVKNEGIEISPDEQLPRYHPDFDVDSVDDIKPAKLPEMPKGDAGQPETMREYLKAVPDSSSTLPEKIKMVIKELRSPEKKVAVVADKCIPLSPKKYHVETKNTSKPSLLERKSKIRAKERERKRREMMRNPEMEQRKGRLERISHSLLQCICSFYNLKKVGSMKFSELIDKLAFSIGSISKVEIEAAVCLLCEVCPTYFKIVEVRGEKYIHLKENSFSTIRDIVNAEVKKCI
uniref:CDT1 domain-containing protein n=1 Tax=Elaeophora elaphi TaxID=1147741 RepID=A0A0R3S3X2_9BILA